MTLYFPYAPNDVRFELYYDAGWHDISSYVRETGSGEYCTITRGAADESSRPDPAVCRLQLNNTDGRFSPRNPTGALYGKIGRNTPFRVYINHTFGPYPRFYGEISQWPVTWETDGNDVWVPIEASGITRRLGSGDTPLKSTLRREQESATTLVAYWPMEDGDSSTQFASAIAGQDPLTLVAGSSDFAGSSDIVSSAPIPIMNSGRWQAAIPTYTTTGETQVRFICSATAGPSADSVLVSIYTTGTAARWEIMLPSGGGDLHIRAYNTGGINVLDSTIVPTNPIELNTRISMELTQSGSNVNWAVRIYFENEAFAVAGTGTLSSFTVGRVRSVHVGDSGLVNVALGHVSVGTDITSIFDMQDAFNAYRTERALTRAVRLCTENGIANNQFAGATLSTSQRMGSQKVAKLLDLLDECRGLGMKIHDDRTQFGLVLIGYEALWEKDPAWTLDYGSLVAPFLPTEDDLNLTNDVTVSRIDGASSRATVDTGPLSTQAPPNGVGTYDSSVRLNLADDTITAYHAAWRAAFGTWDEPRYPQLTIDLLQVGEDASILSNVAAVDVADVIQVDGLPSWVPPGPLLMLVEGYAETLGPWCWQLTFNAQPAGPWLDAWRVEDATRGHVDSADSTTAASFTAGSGTSLSVAFSSVRWVTPADQAGAFPFDIMVSGVRLHVTSISGTTSPQTFTVSATPVNGVAKVIPSGSEVHVYRPMRVGL